jgi:hypothetical protein
MENAANSVASTDAPNAALADHKGEQYGLGTCNLQGFSRRYRGEF